MWHLMRFTGVPMQWIQVHSTLHKGNLQGGPMLVLIWVPIWIWVLWGMPLYYLLAHPELWGKVREVFPWDLGVGKMITTLRRLIG